MPFIPHNEKDVRDMLDTIGVSDIEQLYWLLYFKYRELDAAKTGRDSALATWERVYTLFTGGGAGGEAGNEAQAREQYFAFRSAVEEMGS